MRKLLIAISFIALSLQVGASTLNLNEDGTFTLAGQKVSLIKMAKEYGELTKTNIYISNDVKKKRQIVSFYGKKTIKRDELDRFIISLLSTNDIAVIRNKDKTELNLLSLREVRYDTLPLYREIKNVPKTKEYVSYFHKTTHLSAKQMERALRPFTSRAGRIYSEENSKGIIISDYAIHAHFLLEMIKMSDLPSVKKVIDEQKEFNKELKELAKTKPPIEETIEKHLYLFIALFSLIALIIGFMLRGFVIRRIEGGL